MPWPALPAHWKAAGSDALTMKRSMKSRNHAAARGSGPARRSVISAPSGSETDFSVSITRGCPPASGRLEEDIAVSRVDRAPEHRHQHEPSQSQRDRGEDREEEA